MTIREDLAKIFNFHISENSDIADYFRLLEASGKVSQTNLISVIITCLKHIEELEKNGTQPKGQTSPPVQRP